MKWVALLCASWMIGFAGCGSAEYEPSQRPIVDEPIDESIVRLLTAKINGGDVDSLTSGETHLVTGEFELVEGSELTYLQVKVVGSFGEHDTVTLGYGSADCELIDGNRYSYSAELLLQSRRTGEAELQFFTGRPAGGKVCVLREPVTIVAAPPGEPTADEGESM